MSSGAAAAAGPKLQHAIRSKAGVAAFWGASEVSKIDGFAGYVITACFPGIAVPTTVLINMNHLHHLVSSS